MKNLLKSLAKSTPAILASIIAVVGITYAAGSLTAPSGTPANTSYTLQDIYNLASGATTTIGSGAIPSTPGSVSLTYPSLTDVYEAIDAMPKARTLQTFGTSNYCTSSSNVIVPCTGTGEDAEFNTGIPRSYTDNGDGTISDNNTGLMWQKCVVGQSGTNCETGTATETTFAAATSTCTALSLGGFDDWRVPNVHELFSLINVDNIQNINITYFPNVPLVGSYGVSRTWTSSHSVREKNKNIVVNFRSYTYYLEDTSLGLNLIFRCVRGGL